MPGLRLILRRRRHSRLLAVNLLVTLLALAGIIAYIANAQTIYQITLYPLADARVTSSAANTNYGADQTSRIYQGDRFYIKFNFTATGITQQMPNLRYYVRFYVPAMSAYTFTIYIYATKNDWDESTITWNNKPSENSTTAIASASPSLNTWNQLDITNWVAANCMTKTCSFIITVNSITSGYSTTYFMDVRTKDYSDQNYWPHVLIQYSALSTVTQTFTVTSTETVTQTQTATETVTTTQTFTVYSTSTITTVTTSYTTVTETTTEVVPATTVTYTSTIATETQTAWTETIHTETVYSTTTRKTTTTIPVTVYQTLTQTETVNQTVTGVAGIESGMVNSILQLFTIMLPIMIIFVVIRSIMGVLR
jgi:hypothetical protein